MSLIGRDTTTNKDIEIEQGHRTRGLYIIGATGSGKSVLTEQLAVQDAKDGLGFCVLDPHGDLINNIMVRIPKEREKDVILLDPTDTAYPFGLNLFSCTNPEDPLSVELAVNQITHVFEKIFGMSKETPRLSQFVRQIAYTFVGTDYTMCEIPYLLLDKAFRDRVVPKYGTTGLFWKSFGELRPQEQLERAESTLDRIDSLISNQIIRTIVGQTQTTLDFRQLMESGRILLISLHAQLDAMTDLLGSIIIGQILLAALSRSDTTKRRQFNLYVDEFQKFATPDMSTLLVEARKYAIGTTIAHQSRFQSGLTDNIRSTTLQAASLVCFRVTPEDTEFLAPSFDTTPPEVSKNLTIPSDVLYHLTDHPSESVKDFERKFVRPMLQAKGLDIQSKRIDEKTIWNMKYSYRETEPAHTIEVIPEYEFYEHAGSVKFYPEDLQKALSLLEDILYRVMTDKTYNAYSSFHQLLPYITGFLNCRDIYRKMREEKMFENDNEHVFQYFVDQAETLKAGSKEWREVSIFGYFYSRLYATCFDLRNDPIYVSPSTGQTFALSQQTHADRQAQIANELTHLPIGTAKVRVPKWDKDAREVVMVEHTIRTILPYTPKADLARLPEIRQKYLEQTRKLYCRPRREVEEEIRRRILPPPSTTRRDSI